MATWIQINGALTAISVGSKTNVWGVNSAGNIWRYTRNDADPWVQIRGGLSDIGVAADGTVWGVNSAGNIWRYTGDDADPWVQIRGGLVRISVGSKTNVWGVNSAGNIWRYTGDDADPWVQIRGGLSDIGVAADGAVWGVNSAGNIWRYTGDDADPWVQIRGGLVRISVGSKTNVWGVNSAGNIWRYTGDDADPWVQIRGGLSDIGVAADGTVWGVNSAGNIWRYTGDDANFWVTLTRAWDSGQGNWNGGRTIWRVGDFIGSGKAQIAAAYDYDGSHTALFLFSFDSKGATTPTRAWDSGQGKWKAQHTTWLAGDFIGSDKAQIAAAYDHGDSDTELSLFSFDSKGVTTPTIAWISGQTNWAAARTFWRVGDFIGSGKAQITAIYNYGGSHTALFLFSFDSKGVTTPTRAWDSGQGKWKAQDTTWLAGDFIGSGKAQIAAAYDYGDSDTELSLFSFDSRGVTTPTIAWISGQTNWAAARTFWRVGDFIGSGKAQIAAAYIYGGSHTALFLFSFDSKGAATLTKAWDSGKGNWNGGRITWLVGDFTGSGKAQIAAAYDYGGSHTALFLFSFDSKGAATLTKAWDSGKGNWDTGRTGWLVGDFTGSGKAQIAAAYDYGGSHTALFLFSFNSKGAATLSTS